MTILLKVSFGVHVSLDRVAGMVSGIAAYGNVTPQSDRAFSVEVFRASKLPNLKSELAQLEQYGFLIWEEISN